MKAEMPIPAKLRRLLLAAALIFHASPAARAEEWAKVVHVYVALCDNEHQGIVPVPPSLGDGDDPGQNLYWGALYGVKAYFKRSRGWQLLLTRKDPSPAVLERCVFKRDGRELYVVADAYRGRDIEAAVAGFLRAAAGRSVEKVALAGPEGRTIVLEAAGGSNLAVYLGHDGLMDFTLSSYPWPEAGGGKPVMVLACLSRSVFSDALKAAKARPVVWTTGLLAPEAYILRAAVESWASGDTDGSVAARAAEAYHRFQKCGLKAAKKLLVSGW